MGRVVYGASFKRRLADQWGAFTEMNYAIGVTVEKIGGDYNYRGEIRGIVHKKNGATRYVVENSDGLLFIFNPTQLRIIPDHAR